MKRSVNLNLIVFVLWAMLVHPVNAIDIAGLINSSSHKTGTFPQDTYAVFTDIEFGKNTYVYLWRDKLFIKRLEDGPTKVVNFPHHGVSLLFENNVLLIQAWYGVAFVSTNLKDWTTLVPSDSGIAPSAVYNTDSTQLHPFAISQIIFDDGQFKILTKNNTLFSSQDGLNWNNIGSTTPDKFVDPSVTISSPGSYLFRSHGAEISFQQFTSGNYQSYLRNQSGQSHGYGIVEAPWNIRADEWVPNSLLFAKGKWTGLFSGIFVEENEGSNWQSSHIYLGNASTYQYTSYSYGRFDNPVFLGAGGKGIFTSKDGYTWELSSEIGGWVEQIEFIPQLDCFLVLYVTNYENPDYSLAVTRDGKEILETILLPGFAAKDICYADGKIMVAGYGNNNVYMIEASIEEGGILQISDALQNPAIPLNLTEELKTRSSWVLSSLTLTSSKSNSSICVLSSPDQVFTYENGEWTQTHALEEGFWVAGVTHFGGKFYVSTKNHEYHYFYTILPPRGKPQSQLALVSETGRDFISEGIQNYRHFKDPSHRGPFLAEAITELTDGRFNDGSIPKTTILYGVSGSKPLSFLATSRARENTLWARGKYHFSFGDAAASTPFITFKDERYLLNRDFIESETQGIRFHRTWFGYLDADEYPHLKHATLGEVEFLVLENESVYVFSDKFGVLKTTISDSPNVTDLTTGKTYFIDFNNFSSEYDLPGETNTPFYDKETGEWMDNINENKNDVEVVYVAFEKYTAELQHSAANLVSLTQRKSAFEAIEAYEEMEVLVRIVSHFHKMGSSILANSTQSDLSDEALTFWRDTFANTLTIANDAFDWADDYYQEHM